VALKGYRFSAVEGQRVGRRAVGFLEEILEDNKEDTSLTAKTKFDSLDAAKGRDVRRRFDYWLDFGIKDTWFHGWPNDLAVKECFSFRWEERGRQRHRFYGFLYHPQPKTNSARQICVLTYHGMKSDWNTDRSLLVKSMSLRSSLAVRSAIAVIFPDEESPKGRKTQ
jgi:hypothetical protein